MTVLVDTAQVPAHGGWWSHLASDVSAQELHEFAARLGVPRRAFEGDHYDVPDHQVQQAIDLGAELVTTRELLRRLRAAGLRTPKRRGEKVVATEVVDGRRVDVVRSRRVPAPYGVHRIARVAADRLEVVDGDLPTTDDLAQGRVVGFRRRWIRHDGAFDLRHDGVVVVGELPAGELPAGELPAGELPAGELPAGEPSAGELLAEVPGEPWWAPLLRPET